MIEVLFAEGEACSMKCAKSRLKRINSTRNGPTAVIGNPPQNLERPEEWTAIPGTPDEVICLSYRMDIGDIRQPFDSVYRQEMILDLHMHGRQFASEAEREAARSELLRYQQYARLQELIRDGNPVRIWYSHAPYAYCGLCWLCYGLGNGKADIMVVSLPEYRMRADSVIVRYKSWNETAAEEFGSFLHYQKKLTMPERRMYATEWSEMLDAGAMLRAVVNGKLLGVPEDFYDFLILQRLTKKPEKEARVVGDILGYSQIGVGDEWYFYRIRRLAEEGKIQAVKDSDKPDGLLIFAK